MHHVKCPNCLTDWAPVPNTMKAHPGRCSIIRTVTAPLQDVDGKALGTRQVETSNWVWDGASASMVRVVAPELTTYAWDCRCGTELRLVEPTFHVVPCQHAAGPAGVCLVRQNRANPPADRYVNPRHGAACPCCGHQGTHRLHWGQTATCGATPEA